MGGRTDLEAAPTPTEGPQILDTATLVVGAVVGLVLIGGFLTLTLSSKPTDAYVLFVSGPLVTTFVGGVLAKRVQRVESVARVALQATHEVRGIVAQQSGVLPTQGPAADLSPAAAGRPGTG